MDLAKGNGQVFSSPLAVETTHQTNNPNLATCQRIGKALMGRAWL